MTTINKKINHIYLLLEKLSNGEEIYPQNSRLQEEFDIDERTLRRYLKDIEELYGHIVTTTKRKKEINGKRVTLYRVLDKERDVSKVIKFFLDKSDDLSWLLQLVHENSPSLLKEYKQDTKDSLEKIIKEDENIFLFIGSPFENMDNEEFKTTFAQLKSAVKNHEYRDIIYQYNKNENLKDLKCLKIVYMKNNWYVAVETLSEEFRFLRLSFIKNIKYSFSKIGFKQSSVQKYNTFFASLQNPMTLNKPFEKAILQASSRVAVYFKKNMKLFFPSQKYICQNSDGSIDFSIDFTHAIEILPFIKSWQPDIKILSPQNLQNSLKQDLQASLNNYNY